MLPLKYRFAALRVAEAILRYLSLDGDVTRPYIKDGSRFAAQRVVFSILCNREAMSVSCECKSSIGGHTDRVNAVLSYAGCSTTHATYSMTSYNRNETCRNMLSHTVCLLYTS